MSEYLNVYRTPSETLSFFRFDGFQATIRRSRTSGEIPYAQYEDNHRIFITLEGHTRSTIAEIDTLPTVRRPDRPGATTIVPAGVRRRVLLQDIDFLLLDMRVSDAFLRHCREDDAASPHAGSFELPIVQNVRSARMLRAADAFKDAAVGGAPAMQMQTLAYAMVKHLARSSRKVSESGGLDPRALSRVLQLMHDRLSEDVTLIELAAEAGLGVSAFSRGFRKSLGMTPYRYFLAARLHRAKELLAQSDLPIAAIAGVVGYADQAHFTAAFTRETGLPPGKWRAATDAVPRILPISRKTPRHAAL